MNTSSVRRILVRPCLSAVMLACLVPTSTAQERLGSPFALIANQGQWADAASYCAPRGSGALAWFGRDGFVLDLRSAFVTAKVEGEPEGNDDRNLRYVVKATFEGAHPKARLEPARKLSGYYNFFIGNDSNRWRSNVPAYAELRYVSMYQGVDVVVREGRGLFAYDLHIAAGTDPRVVVVRLDGAQGISITKEGDLVIETPHGDVRQSAPIAWQGVDQDRTPVRARFVRIDAKRYGFAVDRGDPRLPLVIDPDVTWATYVGGTLTDPLLAMTQGTPKGPNSPVTAIGRANSTDFPTTTGAYQSALAGGYDGIITRLDPSKSGNAQLVWATYLGGSTVNTGTRNHEAPYAVEIDVLGNVVVAGSTKCTDFPVTTGAFQTTFGGGEADGFFTKLDSKGQKLQYSTFYGGNSNDWICDFELSGVFVASMVGFTNSSNLPKVNAYQSAQAGLQDIFLARLDPTKVGSAQLTYASYLGGSLAEGLPYTAGRNWETRRNLAMDLDKTGRILLASSTQSTNFPTTTGAFQTTNPTTTGTNSGVVTLIDPSKTGAAQLIYSTYLGSTTNDYGRCVALASNGQFVVAGYTNSPGFPTTAGAFDTTLGGTTTDTFVTWLDSSKTGSAQLAYSTLIGGSGRGDRPFNLIIDSHGVANLNGTAGSGFPTTPGAYQRTHKTIDEGYFARLAPDGKGAADLVYSTLIGGGPSANNTHTFAAGSVLDGEGGVFLCGRTRSPQFQTTQGALKTMLQGNNDGFLVHLWGLNYGVEGIGESTPVACAGPLKMGAQGAPTKGNAKFTLTAWGAQANAAGFIGLGLPPRLSASVCAATLYVNPVLVVPVKADAAGELVIPAPIASSTATGTSVVAQLVFDNSGCCLTMTNGLQITVRN